MVGRREGPHKRPGQTSTRSIAFVSNGFESVQVRVLSRLPPPQEEKYGAVLLGFGLMNSLSRVIQYGFVAF